MPTSSQPFTTFISDEQLRIMERLRWHGEALLLLVNLSLTRPDANGRLLTGTGTLNAMVQPGDWFRELERVDAASYVELLVPVTEDHARATAVRRIRDARGMLREGKNEPAIVSARAALEQVKNTPEVKALSKSAKAKNSRDRTQDERWAMVVEDVYSLACGAAHDDETTESFVYSRQDAEVIIVAIAGLVARYGA
ncbi:hypothetical protein SAMN04489712_14419 [Thermomonospora echinospora]|uniref:Uncharacterized protein n=1 Tax=Thermomonospora echinospora TaxID=1992 RepID=A0A1H6E942_9ACTN|nr:hypothetical protein [Thermomonospora echinospora]SEG94232.1 hypothetical protein SAMN04489712_14419 [Thermomonospora echinospora]